jgi:hypothetical protein
VWVQGARAYRALDEHLIPAATFAGLVRLHAVPVAVPLDVEAWLKERRPLLHERLTALAHRLGGQPSSEVRLARGSLRVAATDSPEDRAAVTLAGRLDAVLPRIRLTDLLEEVDRWTGFVELFEHAGTGRPPAERRVFLATLIAEATNLGLARMAQVSPGMTRRQLVWTATWHLREENFAVALDRLVELQQKAPLAEVFGGGAMSSSDGQHFYLGGPGEAVGAVNARYGRDPAIKLYTHLSDRYAPFHVKVIAATAGEAAHVLDGLLHTRLGTAIVAHAADGGAVSDHVFGLCALLGYRFTPRMPRLDDRRLHAFEPRMAHGAVAPLIGERLDPDLIRGQWHELLRLAASVRTGTVSASLRLCCTDKLCGRAEPYPCSGLRDADVLRASELEHAVQDVGSNGHFGRPTPVHGRAQRIADHPLPAGNVRLDQGAPIIAGCLPPAHAAALGDASQMPVALRRRDLGRPARHRARARWHDDRGARVAPGDLAMDVVPVVRAIGGERGDRAVHLVEQGANPRAIVGRVAGQLRRDDPARVGVRAEVRLLP